MKTEAASGGIDADVEDILKSCIVPAPPEAMMGTGSSVAVRRFSSVSKPAFSPSASMEFMQISPAPRATPCLARAMASMPVFLRPPST